jgi:hypothetical protein
MAPALTLLTYLVFLLTLLIVATGHLPWWVGLIVFAVGIVVWRELISMKRIVGNEEVEDKEHGHPMPGDSAQAREGREGKSRRRRRRRAAESTST